MVLNDLDNFLEYLQFKTHPYVYPPIQATMTSPHCKLKTRISVWGAMTVSSSLQKFEPVWGPRGPGKKHQVVAGKWILIPHMYAIYCNIMQLHQRFVISLDLTNPTDHGPLSGNGVPLNIVDHSFPIDHVLCFMIVRYPPPIFGQTYIKILQIFNYQGAFGVALGMLVGHKFNGSIE